MSVLHEAFTLNTGASIPKIGFGTWQIPNGDVAYNAVTFALHNGYRHIDTARVYGNEESVGKAIKDSQISREELFITTKLPAEIKTYEGALEAFDTSLSTLGLEYVDLYLIHAPWPWSDQGGDYTEGNIQAWKALEEIYHSGKAKAIGVSNFNVKDMQAILENGTVIPAANQIRFFIGHTQPDVTNFCQENNILVEAYSPLATGQILDNEHVAQIAEKYNVSVAQVCIRYTLQKGTLPLPKSTHEEYILQNAAIDFELSAEDMAFLDQLEATA